MNPIIVPLESAQAGDGGLCGNKAAALSTLLRSGVRVPRGFCVTTGAYRRFVEANGLAGVIALELGRKRLEDMRWEEMWDASLRIRNAFLRAPVPDEVHAAVAAAVKELIGGGAAAVRSSSLFEDAAGGSFAGLHESVVNVHGTSEVIDALRSVWASLWSDTVLAYAKELAIDEQGSAMAVVVQEMIAGERSGVAFGVNPNNERESVIEAVFGLNKGLVDGEVQPDRWLLDRHTGSVLSVVRAEHDRHVVPDKHGVRFEKLDGRAAARLPLSERDVGRIFEALRRTEKIFGSPQDMEWTIRKRTLYILQSRPITTGHGTDTNERRAFDLSLKRSFETLKEMAHRIENDLVPRMIAEADEVAASDPAALDDAGLAAEIARRTDRFETWKEIYWNEFIPFAHGVRLFGRVYNDRMKPDDPYEFVDLLSAADTLSVKRNRMLESLAADLAHRSDFETAAADDLDPALDKRLEAFITTFSGLSCQAATCEDEKRALFALVKELARGNRSESSRRGEANGAGGPASAAQAPSRGTAHTGSKGPAHSGALRRRLLEAFMARFERDEKNYARELYEIARKSYRLRDDDNIYLGRFEAAVTVAMDESRRRLGERCDGDHACTNPEEVMRALRFPAYTPRGEAPEDTGTAAGTVRARQLRGQPAGAGVARGAARVVLTTNDLFAVRSGEILVCDAIDPNMTFVIPLVSGIVERRGGMLVHGAIVAREYGLPCVTGVPDATHAIRTGEELTVDGYYGLVIIHRE